MTGGTSGSACTSSTKSCRRTTEASKSSRRAAKARRSPFICRGRPDRHAGALLGGQIRQQDAEPLAVHPRLARATLIGIGAAAPAAQALLGRHCVQHLRVLFERLQRQPQCLLERSALGADEIIGGIRVSDAAAIARTALLAD